MTKKIIFSLAFCALLGACKNENPQMQGGESVSDMPQAQVPNEGKPSEQMAARAIPEGDIYGRARFSLVRLQEEYTKANGVVPGIGTVTVVLDKNLTLLIKNEYKGDVYETKTNLKHLSAEPGGFSIIPDMTADEFPGLKVAVLDGMPAVEIFKNGKKEKEERFLEIYLSNRSSVEQVTPAVLQALQTVHGKI